MDGNVMDLAAYKAKAAEAIVITPDGEPLFNERDTEALDRHSKAAGYAYNWRDASGNGLTTRAVIEVGRNWAACKRIAKGAFKDWFEYTGGWPVEGGECFINAYELSLKHNAILNLPARAILLVSCPATPAAARTKIIKRVEAGEKLSEDKVEAIISRANGGHKIDLGFW
jgi:hypothetical protein